MSIDTLLKITLWISLFSFMFYSLLAYDRLRGPDVFIGGWPRTLGLVTFVVSAAITSVQVVVWLVSIK